MIFNYSDSVKRILPENERFTSTLCVDNILNAPNNKYKTKISIF